MDVTAFIECVDIRYCSIIFKMNR